MPGKPFKSCASANFATPAYEKVYRTNRLKQPSHSAAGVVTSGQVLRACLRM
jgi:hypothetical protein